MSEIESDSRRLQGIDVLRGVAILAVMAIHIPHDAPGGWREHPFFWLGFLADFGYLGVPLFIIISGFCIHRAAALVHASTGRYTFSWAQFWKRRFIRLYPTYVVAIVLSLFAAFYLHDRFAQPERFLGWDLLTHLLLIHNLTDEFATSLGNGAFWSLGTEEQLYALYFVLLALFARFSPRRGLVVALLVTLSWRLLTPQFPEVGPSLGGFHLGQWFQWPFYYWYHWALGAFAVAVHAGRHQLPGWCRSLGWAVVLVALGMLCNRVTFDLLIDSRLPLTSFRSISAAGLQTLHGLGELVSATGFFCLLNYSLRADVARLLRSLVARAVAGIGRISYSLYLVHIPVLYTLEQQVPMGFDPLNWALRYLLYGGVILTFGYAFHHAVERWFLHGRWPRLSPRIALARSAGG